MPGHKALFWIAPALACRLVTRARAGASTSVLGTVVTTFLLGGQLGGGWFMMPLLAAAGATLDAGAWIVERYRYRLIAALPVLAMTGLAANLICFIKRLFDPVGALFSAGDIQDLLVACGYHALFGAAAGIVGATCGRAYVKYQQHRTKRSTRPVV
jgi:hypothetical protein